MDESQAAFRDPYEGFFEKRLGNAASHLLSLRRRCVLRLKRRAKLREEAAPAGVDFRGPSNGFELNGEMQLVADFSHDSDSARDDGKIFFVDAPRRIKKPDFLRAQGNGQKKPVQ